MITHSSPGELMSHLEKLVRLGAADRLAGLFLLKRSGHLLNLARQLEQIPAPKQKKRQYIYGKYQLYSVRKSCVDEPRETGGTNTCSKTEKITSQFTENNNSVTP